MNKEDRKETEKMMKIINDNHEAAYKRYVSQQQKNKIINQKKEDKKAIVNFISIIFVFMVLLGLMITMLVWLEKDNEEFMNTCTSQGYSENWCRSELGL